MIVGKQLIGVLRGDELRGAQPEVAAVGVEE